MLPCLGICFGDLESDIERGAIMSWFLLFQQGVGFGEEL